MSFWQKIRDRKNAFLNIERATIVLNGRIRAHFFQQYGQLIGFRVDSLYKFNYFLIQAEVEKEQGLVSAVKLRILPGDMLKDTDEETTKKRKDQILVVAEEISRILKDNYNVRSSIEDCDGKSPSNYSVSV